MSEEYFEEEEFTSQVNGRTLIGAKQGLKHWPMMLGFPGQHCPGLGGGFLLHLPEQAHYRRRHPGRRYRSPDPDCDPIRRLYRHPGDLVLGFIYFAGVLGERVQYDLRRRMVNHLQNLSLSYFNRMPVGWIMSRVTSDSRRVGELVSWGFLDITWGVTNIIAALAFMAYINWRLAILVFFIIPILIVVSAQFKKKILVEYRKVRKLNSKITSSYNENITGVRVVKSLRREEANLREFDDLAGDMYQAGFRAAWLSALFLPIVQLISAFGVAGVVWYGGIQYESDFITIGGIQAFISYITFMLWPVQELARVYASMQQAVASAERIFSLLDEEPEIQGPAGRGGRAHHPRRHRV
jgi:ATP-binding cassette, subfamily B, bacterial